MEWQLAPGYGDQATGPIEKKAGKSPLRHSPRVAPGELTITPACGACPSPAVAALRLSASSRVPWPGALWQVLLPSASTHVSLQAGGDC
jgi:hypothetical protein